MTAPTAERVLTILPAWNEAESIAAVIKELQQEMPGMDVLVVDDCSRDATARVARAAGAKVLRLPYNLGVGGARRLGYRYAVEHDYDIAVQMDADGQHDPRYIRDMVEALDRADLVIGARFAGEGAYQVRGPRQWAMKLLSKALSVIAKTKLTDTTSGFRACRGELINFYAYNFPVEYLGDTVDTIVQAKRSGYAITQIPVSMRPRQGGTPSASPAKSMVYLFRSGLALLLALVRR
ncbi:glycosyltransferase family 2 protein [Paractinoplanes ferrugineus]|uniref:Glycosyl transferase family 2 n=1 Tax=Paractinoplanes ferrugineus TaxID=113564 RepID=A0A919IUB8_9ACTN|nr:glycosyltransferase family 2 protein [Actinoplanes ferrugineus]GIE08660.1 glycosyl transferase family 2 [Actinoplanes ferrugineus]